MACGHHSVSRDCLQPVPSAQMPPASGPLYSVGLHLSALLPQALMALA